MLFSRLIHAARSGAAQLPSLCAVCHGWGSRRVCGSCVLRFDIEVRRCLRCAAEVPAGVERCGACVTNPPPYSRTFAAVDYAHPWDQLISNFKFHGALDLASALTQRLLDVITHAEAPVPALLVPVPLSIERLRERGYNQAWEIARRLGVALRCPADSRLLLRVKDTPHQLAFAPAQRASNVRGAFAVEPRRLGELRGRRVTLVDDVMTSGATVAEAASTLLRAGASEVDVWVIARTPLDTTDD